MPTSKLSIIFNDNNNPLTRVLWTQAFHYTVPQPFKSSCLGEEEGWAGAIRVFPSDCSPPSRTLSFQKHPVI